MARRIEDLDGMKLSDMSAEDQEFLVAYVAGRLWATTCAAFGIGVVVGAGLMVLARFLGAMK